MVDESKFSNKTYDDLLRIYEKLPSYMGKQVDFPCWFGNEEKGDTYFSR